MSETEQQTVDEQEAPPADAPAPDAQAENAAEPSDVNEGPEVHEAELPEAQDAPQGTGGGQIDILLDSPMAVTAQLGSARPPVRELLDMGPGSVLKLDRQVGEPIDLFLRGVRFATGHLVVVGDNLGVRIKEILPAGQEGA